MLHTHRPARRAKRVIAAAGIVALVATVAAGCGSGSGSAAGTAKPVLRVGVQKDGIRAVLGQAGLLKDLPYTIEWSEFTAGPPIIEAASADRIDVAWVGSAPPIFGAASGAAFKIVAAVQQRSKRLDSVLVPKGSPIHSIKDLKGKKVAVGKGTSANGLLLNELTQAGLTLADVQAQYLSPADGQAAFKSGSVDAWAVWDPYVQQAVDQLGAVDITENGTVADPSIQFEVGSSASLADAGKRANIKDFVNRVKRGFDWASTNSDKWGDGWAAESGLSADVLRKVAKNKAADVIPVNDGIVADEQKLADAFFGAGLLPKKVDFKTIVEPGLT